MFWKRNEESKKYEILLKGWQNQIDSGASSDSNKVTKAALKKSEKFPLNFQLKTKNSRKICKMS